MKAKRKNNCKNNNHNSEYNRDDKWCELLKTNEKHYPIGCNEIGKRSNSAAWDTESSERSSYGQEPQRGFFSLLAQVSWGVWKVFHHEALASIHTESFLLLCTFYKMACPGGRCRCSWMEDKKGERFRATCPLSRHPLILHFLRGRVRRRWNSLH